MVPEREPPVKRKGVRTDSIGSRLREERERLGLSQETFGGAKTTQIRYEKGTRSPDASYLNRVADAGADVQYIVTGRRGSRTDTPAPVGFVLIPRYDVAPALNPGGSVIEDEPRIADYLAFKEEWVRNVLGVIPSDLLLTNSRGDSMSPTISDGDLLLVNKRRQSIEDAGIYMLRLADSVMVKRLQLHLDGSVTVSSDNPKYQPETVKPRHAGELAIVGRVVWHGRRI